MTSRLRFSVVKKRSGGFLTNSFQTTSSEIVSGQSPVCVQFATASSLNHGDVILREFKYMFPDAFDRDDPRSSFALVQSAELYVAVTRRTS